MGSGDWLDMRMRLFVITVLCASGVLGRQSKLAEESEAVHVQSSTASLGESGGSTAVVGSVRATMAVSTEADCEDGMTVVRSAGVEEISGKGTVIEIASSESAKVERHCLAGEFRPAPEAECRACHAQCLPGYCVDGLGCIGCVAGHYYARSEGSQLYGCYPCTVANCRLCQNGSAFLAQQPRCVECEAGYFPINDASVCYPDRDPVYMTPSPHVAGYATSSMVSPQTAESMPSTEAVVANRVRLGASAPESASTCELNGFVSLVEHYCAMCDQLTDCAKEAGCMPGYYKRLDAADGYACSPCTLDHCAICRDVPSSEAPSCRTCEDGYHVDAATKTCAPS